MPVTTDIVATYRGPRTVFRRLLDMGENEGRALAILMAGCAVFFVAQWPALSREAHLTDQELNPLLGGSLMAWIFIAPLIFYAIAFVSQFVLRAMGGAVTGFATRLALFWAFLAASPLKLLHGLVAGFIGPGQALTIVGAIWLAVFLWFWVSNLREAGWGAK
ncbi:MULTISPECIES: YIP1 family protein [Roseovarius]|uniref:YIP1 family protein n=2 Tax=Roseovarius TaxID=74030 RepID=A0ABZ2HFY6_9RHOB|nr:YIP1 family protein [Roseovarius sp. W115]MDV2928070.1 YIP1 family protein [Roseovarius sp. W115]